MIAFAPAFAKRLCTDARWLKVPWWFKDTRLNLRERLLLALILDQHDTVPDWNQLSNSYIKSWLGWTDETIRRTIRQLERRRLIKTEMRRVPWQRALVRFALLNHRRLTSHPKCTPDASRRWWKYEAWYSHSGLTFTAACCLGIIVSTTPHDPFLQQHVLTSLLDVSRRTESVLIKRLEQFSLLEVTVTQFGYERGSRREFKVRTPGLLKLQKAVVSRTTENVPYSSTPQKQHPVPHKNNIQYPTKTTSSTPQDCTVNNRLLNTSLLNTRKEEIDDAETSSSDGILGCFSILNEEHTVEQTDVDQFMSTEDVVEWSTQPQTLVNAAVAVATPKAEEVDLECGRQLVTIVRQNGHRPSNRKASSLAQGFAELRRIDGISVKKIKAVLDWYASHMNDEYVPRVYGSQQFREKWNGLVQAKQQWDSAHPPQTQLTEGQQAAVQSWVRVCRDAPVPFHPDLLARLEEWVALVYGASRKWRADLANFVAANPEVNQRDKRIHLDGTASYSPHPVIDIYLSDRRGQQPGIVEYLLWVANQTSHKKKVNIVDWIWAPDSMYELQRLTGMQYLPLAGHAKWVALVKQVRELAS